MKDTTFIPLNKYPGPNCFSNKYYKTFHMLLYPHIATLFEAAISNNSFPPDMLRAYVVTLPKPGKDPNIPANFRPISLLNSDIKLYAKLTVNLFMHIIPQLVQPDQMGFTLGRQSWDAARWIINLIHFAELRHMPSLLLSIDAEKAFNRVPWHYMNQVLLKFGFNGNNLLAILALYSHPSAQVYYLGLLSKLFHISNGQGCPLSPSYDWVKTIRTHPSISSFLFHTRPHMIILFTNDVILTLTNLHISLPCDHEVLTRFSVVSYYKVNFSKSSILDLGVPLNTKNALQSKLPYSWSTGSIPYLGITLTPKESSLIHANYKPLLDKLSV